MEMLKAREFLRLLGWRFRRGLFPGAVAGGVAGLAPGVLLVLVLTGDTYYISGSEVLGFIVMCITAAALMGAVLGGICVAIVDSVRSRFHRS